MSVFLSPWLESYAEQLRINQQRKVALYRQMLTPQMVEQAVNIADLWPQIPAPAVAAAAVAAPEIDPADPIFGDLTSRSLAAYNPMVADAAREARDGHHGSTGFLGIGGAIDAITGAVENTVRVATTAWDALWNEAVARPFKATLATLGLAEVDGVNRGLFGISPVAAWQAAGGNYATEAVVRALRDPIGNFTPLPTQDERAQVNLGTGYIPRSTPGEAGGMLTDPMHQRITRGGQEVTPGRFVADFTWLEPGSAPYNLLSGGLDFAAQILADPAAAALKWGSAARAAHYAVGLREGEAFAGAARLAKLPDWWHGPVAGLMYRTARKTVRASTPNQIINRADGRVLIHWLENGNPTIDDIAEVFSRVHTGIPRQMAAAMVGLKPGEAAPLLRDFLETGTLRSMPRVGPVSRKIGGAIGGAQGAVHGAGGAMRSWAANKSTGFDRLFRQMGNGSLSLERLDAGFWELHRFLRNTGFGGTEEANGWLTRWAKMPDIGPGDEAFDIVTEIKTSLAGRIRSEWAAAGADDLTMARIDKQLQTLTNTWDEHIKNRAFWIDRAGRDSWFPNVSNRRITETGERVVKPDAMLVTEMLQHGVPLPDMRRLRHALSPIRRGAYVKAQEAFHKLPDWAFADVFGENRMNMIMDPIMSQVWRPLVLLRAAWTERIFLDNSARMAVDGLDTMFNDPAAALSWMLNDPDANRLTRILARMKIKPRGAGGAAEMALAALDEADDGAVRLAAAWEHRTALSARDADAVLGLTPWQRGDVEGWRAVGRHEPDGPRGMVHEFLELADEPLVRRIALKGPDEAYIWLTETREGQLHLKRMFDDGRRADGSLGPLAEMVIDPDLLRAHINAAWARMHEKTGGVVELFFNRGDELNPRWERIDRNLIPDDVGEALAMKGAPADAVPQWKRIRYEVITNGDEELLGAIRAGQVTADGGHILPLVDVVDITQRRKVFDALEYKFREGSWAKKGPGTVKAPIITHPDRLRPAVRRFFQFFMTRPMDFATRSPVFRQYYYRRVEELLGHTTDEGRELLYAAAVKDNIDAPTLARWRETIDGLKGTDGGIPAFAPHLDDTSWEAKLLDEGPLPPDPDDLPPVDIDTVRPPTDRPSLAEVVSDNPPAGLPVEGSTARLAPMEHPVPDEVVKVLLREFDWDSRAIVTDITGRGGSLEDLVKALDAQPMGADVELVQLEVALAEAGFEGVTVRGQRHMFTAEEAAPLPRPGELIPESMQEPGDWLYSKIEDQGKKPSPVKGRNAKRVTAEMEAKRASIKIEPPDPLTQSLTSIDHLARMYGLSGVEELLYAAGRKSNLADQLRNIMPFAEAFFEISRTWGRLVWQNPVVLRRGTQAIEGGRASGFFTTDPDSGEEMFNYPGGGVLSKIVFNSDWTPQNPLSYPGAVAAAFGPSTGGAELKLQGRLQGMNLVGGSVLPGFGPVIQMAASRFIPDVPAADTVRRTILPYGEVDTEDPGSLFNSMLPSWMRQVASATMGGTGEQERLRENVAMDVYKALIIQRGPDAPPPTQEEQDAMARRAQHIATKLSFVRGLVAFSAPTPPSVRFHVIPDRARQELGDAKADEVETRIWYFQTLAEEWGNIAKRHNYDEAKAAEEFHAKYGVDPTLFATAKTVTVAKRHTTTEGDKWARNNRDLFEAAPYTAYFAHPDEIPGDFSFDAYGRQLHEKTRVSLTLDQWRSARQDLLGRIRFQVLKEQVDAVFPKGSEAKTRALAIARLQLMAEHPGYMLPDVGVAERPNLAMKIQELIEVWPQHPELADSAAGRGLASYLKVREAVIRKAAEAGIVGWDTAQAAEPLRDLLRAYAAHLSASNADFAHLFHLILEHEFDPDASTLPTGG